MVQSHWTREASPISAAVLSMSLVKTSTRMMDKSRRDNHRCRSLRHFTANCSQSCSSGLLCTRLCTQWSRIFQESLEFLAEGITIPTRVGLILGLIHATLRELLSVHTSVRHLCFPVTIYASVSAAYILSTETIGTD